MIEKSPIVCGGTSAPGLDKLLALASNLKI
jgi:hypothetical protein